MPASTEIKIKETDMLKHKRKPVKSSRLKPKKLKHHSVDLDVRQPEIEGGDFEYGDTNDLFEENIREAVEKGE
jgi:hypothetical protein